MTPLLAWHGCRADGTTRHLKVKELVGVKTFLAGDVELCKNALHGSVRAVDMLRYSEGLWIKRTLHEGKILHDSDKIGSSERTVTAESDATQVVVDWAFWCADRAVRVHAVAALRQAGMNTVAEELASLEAITDKKSALAAFNADYAVHTADYAVHTADAAVRDAAHAADAAANAARAGTAVARAAHAVRAAASTAVASTAVAYAASTAHAAHAAARAAASTADFAVDAAAYASSTAHAANAAASTACAAADGTEMNLLNAELERRLLALMGLISEVTQ